MKAKNIVIILFPALVMFVISIVSFTNIFGLSDLDAKSLILVGLGLIFPVVFVLQGLLSAVTHTKVILSLSVSIVSFIVIIFLFLNSSALGYVLVYVFIEVIGYWIGKYLIKSQPSKGK